MKTAAEQKVHAALNQFAANIDLPQKADPNQA